MFVKFYANCQIVECEKKTFEKLCNFGKENKSQRFDYDYILNMFAMFCCKVEVIALSVDYRILHVHTSTV